MAPSPTSPIGSHSLVTPSLPWIPLHPESGLRKRCLIQPIPTSSLLDLPKIDSKLLTLLVQVASLEPERLCRVGYMVVIAFQFRQNSFTFKTGHTLRQRPAHRN